MNYNQPAPPPTRATIERAIKQQWTGANKNLSHMQVVAKLAKECRHCLICGSQLLLPVIRTPMPDWRVHCNHCGSEVLLAVMLNRGAWRITAQVKPEN